MITSAKFVISNSDVRKCPNDNRPEFAFIGRSNVGKSSLINMLTRNGQLAKTSSKPGKTLLINHFLINSSYYIVDLPGYGFARQSKGTISELQRIITSYILQRPNLYNLFLLIDCRLDPQNVDLQFMRFLGENQVPFSIVFTKSDKLSTTTLDANIKSYMNTLAEEWDPLPPTFITSSTKGKGRDELIEYIEHCLTLA